MLRKAKVIAVVTLALLVTIGLQPTSAKASVMANGWYEPVPLGNPAASWMATSCAGASGYRPNLYHTGRDYWADIGTSVVAVGNGTIVQNGDFGSGFARALFIRHTAADGTKFTVLYGHINTSLAAGTTVTAGSQVGTIAQLTGVGPHLHLGLYPGTNYPSSGWGTQQCANWPATNGFVDPVSYLEAHPAPGGTSTVTNPDFNGDQYGDLVWHQGTTLTLFASQGNGGTFGYIGSTGGIGTPTWAGAGDVNGDKQVDVIWYTGTTLAVFKWGVGSWSWVNQTTGIAAADYGVVGDFTGDGKADIAWHQGTNLVLFAGQANSTFVYAGSTGGIGTPQWARAANVNGGSKDEVVWYRNNTFTTLGWTGNGWGWVNATLGIGAADGAAVGDFTGDGRDDIAWHQGTTLHLYGGLSNGKFGYVGGTGGIASGSWTGAADVNKDGKSDVIWYQGTTIHTYGWNGGGWGWMGRTPGISAPGFAVASG